MLSDSIPSSSIGNPIPNAETSTDFEIVLSIITGHAQEVLSRVTTWSQARTLHGIADKYQLDAYRPWFSQNCRNNASEQPWEALFLATNHSPMDQDPIRTAITEGFKARGAKEICDPTYFTKIDTDPTGAVCWRTLRTPNTTAAFGLKLGFSGLLAYNLTIGAIEGGADTQTWKLHEWADKFVHNAWKIEKQRVLATGTSSTSEKSLTGHDTGNVPTSPEETGKSFNNGKPASAKTRLAFNSPSANVTIKTNNNILFRIEDYYLQAAG